MNVGYIDLGDLTLTFFDMEKEKLYPPRTPRLTSQPHTNEMSNMFTSVPIVVLCDDDIVDVIPVKNTIGDVGYDLKYCGMDIRIPSISQGSNSHIAKLKTGIILRAPPGTYIRVAPRSGMSLKGIVINGGVVDPGLSEELEVIAMNLSGFNYDIRKGDKIAQLLFESVHPYHVQFNQVAFI